MDNPYSRTEWRLLHTGARDGATNMAIDEAILEAVTAGHAPATLRFYQWDPPCLSLGISQKAADADREACRHNGWEIVRRPTGGRAILHADELTYSICAPEQEPRVAGSVVDSYGRLAAGLLSGLRSLGLQPAEAKPTYPTDRAQNGPVCFDGPAKYEVTVDLRKLIGSAQSRKLGGVLQHGTLPLRGDLTRIIEALSYESQAARQTARQRLLGRALTLEQALGRQVAFQDAAKAMAAGFAQALNLTLVPAELTASEWAAVERLHTEKYANHQWTLGK